MIRLITQLSLQTNGTHRLRSRRDTAASDAYPHPRGSPTGLRASLIISPGTHRAGHRQLWVAALCARWRWTGGGLDRAPPAAEADCGVARHRGQLVDSAASRAHGAAPRRPRKICLFALFISSSVSFTCSSFISHFHFGKSAFADRSSSTGMRWGRGVVIFDCHVTSMSVIWGS